MCLHATRSLTQLGQKCKYFPFDYHKWLSDGGVSARRAKPQRAVNPIQRTLVNRLFGDFQVKIMRRISYHLRRRAIPSSPRYEENSKPLSHLRLAHSTRRNFPANSVSNENDLFVYSRIRLSSSNNIKLALSHLKKNARLSHTTHRSSAPALCFDRSKLAAFRYFSLLLDPIA